MHKKLSIVIALLGIVAGLVSIFIIVPDTEVAIGFVTISFGIMAIIWTSLALGALSKGSSLKKHTSYFLLCLIFILLFAIWHTMSKLFGWRETLNEYWLYPSYLFITLAFLIFVITSYQTYTMGQELGFGKQAKTIRKVMATKKKNAGKSGA